MSVKVLGFQHLSDSGCSNHSTSEWGITRSKTYFLISSPELFHSMHSIHTYICLICLLTILLYRRLHGLLLCLANTALMFHFPQLPFSEGLIIYFTFWKSWKYWNLVNSSTTSNYLWVRDTSGAKRSSHNSLLKEVI